MSCTPTLQQGTGGHRTNPRHCIPDAMYQTRLVKGLRPTLGGAMFRSCVVAVHMNIAISDFVSERWKAWHKGETAVSTTPYMFNTQRCLPKAMAKIFSDVIWLSPLYWKDSITANGGGPSL